MFIRLGGFVGIIMLIVWLYALFDSITAPADRVRTLPKAVWVILVLLFFDLAALFWFVFGRPRAAVAGAPVVARPSLFRAAGEAARPPVRSTAPDDDPEFLRRLGEQMRRDRPESGDDPRP